MAEGFPGETGQNVIYVFDEDYPPYTYLEKGAPSGFDIDILKAALQGKETATGREILALHQHRQSVNAVAFSPRDGLQVLTADDDGQAILWPAVSWKTEAVAAQETAIAR